MKLTRLLSGVIYEVVCGDINIEVTNVCDNSKMCNIGCVFFAISGTKVDGNVYVSEAINNGAKVIITNKKIEVYNEDITVIKVENVREALSKAAFNYYLPNGYNFKVIGITGTNGKTTTSFMISECLISQGYLVCVVGTSGVFVNGVQLRGEELTTPDPLDIASLFNFLSEIKVDYVIMEVSSHALYLEKVSAIMFDYAIFTNLTEDHLDFFKTMNNYGKAKEKLFYGSKFSIINTSDKFGEDLLNKIKSKHQTYAKEKNADYIIVPLSNNTFKVKYNNCITKFKLPIPGEYNFFNATAAFVVLLKEGIGINKIRNVFKNLKKINGRYNEFKTMYHGKIVLDFAHTPDGLKKVLSTARKQVCNNGRIISVFGCGGNRDKDKRSIMGAISGEFADYTIISIDNPRWEKAESVMADIESGIKAVTSNYEILMPRVSAVRKAIEMSQPGDVVVISGKGTEPYYEIMGKKEYYREDIVISSIIKTMERK